MKNLIVGNGINIQFGGYEYTNKLIIHRAIESCKESNYPKYVIVDDPKLILKLVDMLFDQVNEVFYGDYDKYAVSSDEKKALKELRNRYKNYDNIDPYDVGFEDYYLIYDLLCHKNKIYNPDKYIIRETLKRFFLYSIFNKGKVNIIHRNYPHSLYDFFNLYDNIFTTNYDRNLEIFIKRKIFYLHGAFHIRADVYNPNSMRNKLYDKPVENCKVDEKYYYLYSNALTSYSGYSKEFSINQGKNANEAIEKMAKVYVENENIRKDIDSWKDNKNDAVRKLYESVKLKIKYPDLKFDETYPIKQFHEMNGSVGIIGLSPFNDGHIFNGINKNDKVENVVYYFYNENEKEMVRKVLNKKSLKFTNINYIWDSYK
ncbi:hypothetical protein [Clostridium tyrobutyricum]|uniref:hypothetical protein n=1 Tax=Clostridium tyrobutyricum TaxID=1519 RepID=UPI000301FC6C|nr:hypothetical protein [Clostridium tyrobutyricum]